MPGYTVEGLPDEITAAARTTMRSPQYGHPAVKEIAAGTGPCRACLEPFIVGAEERLLFTYRPDGGNGSLGAPGPVFIHARSCTRYHAHRFPPALATLHVIVEARAAGNRVPFAQRVPGTDVDALIEQLFEDDDVDYINVRHGEAGCHIVRIDRAEVDARVAMAAL